VTLNSFYFGCTSRPFVGVILPAICSVMVVTKSTFRVATVATYGPFTDNLEINGTTHQQDMMKVTGPFSGQYLYFVVTGGPGSEILYLDDLQITNSYSGSSCTSLG